MHRATLRGFNGKSKHAAVVSPVIDDDDRLEGDINAYDEPTRGCRKDSRSNNGDGVLQGPRDEDVAVEKRAHYQIQQKSATQETSAGVSYLRINLGQLFGSHNTSNQDIDPGSDAAAVKYGVLGQKQQWRKHRAQRQRQPQTISSMAYDGEDLDELERAPPQSTQADDRAIDCHDASEAFVYSQASMPSPPPSSRSISSTSCSSDAHDSSTSSLSGSDKQRFVITQQKRSTYTAKLNIPGQKPLYLGRYKSEEAAQAACERAFSVILTPRGADTW